MTAPPTTELRPLGPPERARMLDALGASELDLLVIGGGITGAGVARDATLRGLSVALVEREDFASGTSSRSSRLVHGGIRYLEHGHLGLVFESSRERRTLLRIAPHLVRPLRFVWPFYQGSRIPRWKLRAGFLLYDALSLFRNVARHRALDAAGVLGREPSIRQLGLEGGFGYYDAACDDARLTLANAIDAARGGAIVVNHVAVRQLETSDGAPLIALEDTLGGTALTARARVVVNATGPWSDAVRRLAGGDARPALRSSKGAHIAVPRERIRNGGALTLTSPIDGRVMFVLPAGRLTIISTTETEYDGPPEEVRASEAEVVYLLRTANAFFPAAHLTAADVVSAWAGIRPLADSSTQEPGRVSREHAIAWSTPRLLSVTGGKLTTYRAMAAEVVDHAMRKLGREMVKSATGTRLLPGGTVSPIEAERARAVAATGDPSIADHLVGAYGTEWRIVWTLATEDPALGERLVEGLPYLRAELRHAVTNEMALTLTDILVRRLHLAFQQPDHGMSVARAVANDVAPLLEWDAARVDRELARYARDVARIFGIER